MDASSPILGMQETSASGGVRWLLLIDTCGDPGSVGLATLPSADLGGAVLQAERKLPGRQTQEQLLPTVSEVLSKSNLRPGDLHAIGVVTGPGSFTGVRVGLAAAKGLAEALGVPLVGVSRLAVLASQTGTPETEAWIGAGRRDVFRGRYQQGECLTEDMLPLSEAVAKLSEHGAVVMEEALLPLSPLLRLLSPVGVTEAMPLVVEKLRTSDVADAALLDANYLRVPDAELARRARANVSLEPA